MAKIFSRDFFSLTDLYIAYRKAKSEAFYDNMHPCALAFTEYEDNLRSNLEDLYKKLSNKDSTWEYQPDFMGGYLCVPKSIDDSKWSNEDDIHFRSIDPVDDWERMYVENRERRVPAKYRQIITATVDYQVVSALWILKVGHKYEVALDDNVTYGNRLRRKQNIWRSISWFNSDINIDSLGLFAPYFSGYQKWRENGLTAMNESIRSNKNITAITMDLAGFYHNVSPSFMLRRSFLTRIGLELSDDERLFTNKLINSIDTWYRNTPDYENRREGSLPVGLSASKIISNVLLIELDNDVTNGLSPIYYGRYVDDIFIVAESQENDRSGKDVLRWLSQSINCLKVKFRQNEDPELRLRLSYAKDSDLFFTASKQKIFSLSGDHGLDLVDQISGQIRAQSSEYRLLPDVPDTSVEMAEKTLLASSDATLATDALRKADVVSIRRLGFSLLLRDIEQYSKDLIRNRWKSLRQEFYGLVDRYLLTPKGLFELSTYYPRVFKIMIANYDFDNAMDFIDKLKDCLDLIEKTTVVENAGEITRLEVCRSYFVKSLIQAALQASTTKNFTEWTKLGRIMRRMYRISDAFRTPSRKPSLVKVSYKLLLSDLGSRPYKDYWYYDQGTDINIMRVPRGFSIRKVLRLGAIKKFRSASNLKIPHWPALVFPTRSLSIQEMALITPSVLEDPDLLSQSINGLRGAGTWKSRPLGFYDNNGDRYLYVPTNSKETINVALTNVETTDSQWNGALTQRPDRSLKRYKRFCQLVNKTIQASTKVDYVLFPELSVPRRWAIGAAEKLAKQGISFVCGVEYYFQRKMKSTLRNDCLVSLCTYWPGYKSNLIYMQPKVFPAHFESKSLAKVGKKLYKPSSIDEALPIYQHGDYFFGSLICSDLTTPSNRARFEGKVDSLFVLEWNKDVKTFSFLIEGAAHDIHTFVIQVNNRMYGDSRIRAPFAKEHRRDSVRVKGGIEDYYVIGAINYFDLRRFQIRAISSLGGKRTTNSIDELFKPLPIGFVMSDMRKKTKL